MSYILDALRKSEHARQMSTGQGLSVSSTVEFKRNARPWLMPTLIVLVCLISFTLIWWVFSQTLVLKIINSIYKQAFPDVSQSQTMATETLPEFIVKTIDLTDKKDKKRIHIPTNKLTRIPTSADTQQQLPENVELKRETKIVANTTTESDPLKDMPPLNISGYIHEEQNGSIAMINNQLVHEGEEISPGLLLVKILDDSAIFSYKGYVFSR